MIQEHCHSFCIDLCSVFHNNVHLIIHTGFFISHFLCHMCYCLHILPRIMGWYVFICHHRRIFMIFCTNRVCCKKSLILHLWQICPKIWHQTLCYLGSETNSTDLSKSRNESLEFANLCGFFNIQDLQRKRNRKKNPYEYNHLYHPVVVNSSNSEM